MKHLLYLHGVGDDGTRLDWFDLLGVERHTLVAPDYSDLLRAPSSDLTDPQTQEPTKSSPTDRNRHQYRSDQVSLHEELRTFGSVSILPGGTRGFGRVPDFIDAIAEHLVVGLVYDAISHYTREETRRRTIRKRVTDCLPDAGCELVIVGHSLGALVALDLVAHLPDDVEVDLLVTAASTLARRNLPDEALHMRHDFPYHRVGRWLNVYNPSDVVTRGVPIGPRFPQVIDVSVSGSFGDHALATCIADPGVTQVIRGACRDRVRTPEHSEKKPRGMSLRRAEALHLTLTQLTMRMEDLLATQPETTPEELSKFHEARRLAHASSALVPGFDKSWEQDHSSILRAYTTEADIPAVLVRLASADPMHQMQVRITGEVDQRARVQTAVDAGLPPSWIALAQRCLEQVGELLPPIDQAGTTSGAPDREPDDHDPALGNKLLESLGRSLSGLTLAVAQPMGISGLTDLHPAISELMARALVAHQLGVRQPGTEERETLSRFMVDLGLLRARLGRRSTPPAVLADQLQDLMTTVAKSLDWLAGRGIGLLPSESPTRSEYV